MDSGAKRSLNSDENDDGNAESDARRKAVMIIIACVVENRSRETVVAVARNWRSVEIFTLVDNPSYAETTDLLSMLAPDEILLPNSACQGSNKTLLCRKIEEWRESANLHPEIRPISRAYFDQDRGAEFLRRVSVDSIDSEILARYTVLGATFALLKYVETTSSLTFPQASVKLRFIDNNAGEFMTIDRRTALGLEILANARSGDQKNCLFGTINRTKTSGGARFLRQQLLRPSADVATIRGRQEASMFFVDHDDVLSGVVGHLRRVPDLDRVLNRLVSLQEGKRDARVVGSNIKTIIAIKHTMIVMQDVVTVLHTHDTGERPSRSKTMGLSAEEEEQNDGDSGGKEDDDMRDPNQPDLIDAISTNLLPPCAENVLNEITSVLTQSTSFSKNSLAAQHQECFAVSVGVDGLLDVARKTYLQTVEEIYAEAENLAITHSCAVKVHYTQARGYHLKLPGTLASLPDGGEENDAFIQCVKSNKYIACTTAQVASLSDRAQEAIQEALNITDNITQALLEWLQGFLPDLFAQAEALAMLDVLMGFAELKLTSNRPWCCPQVRESGPLVIKQGRHPILDKHHSDHTKVTVNAAEVGIEAVNSSLKSSLNDRNSGGGEDVVPNDTFMDNFSSLHVVSGVNGSGKTTYLKQVALITVLAQIGCFVPAEECFLPVRQRLLSRIGTGDDIENNLSTFLMEMKDAAYICKHSGERSLVLVDELGRGTANRDGSAIAWGVAEALMATNTNFCLFVTHYPLLLNLASVYPNVKNVHLAVVVSSGGKLDSYKHQVTAGASVLATDYGIDLAERMGISSAILTKAREVKVKLIEAAPPGVDEQRTGGDLGRLSHMLKQLLRRLSSLKGASIDGKTLCVYLDKLKAQLSPEQTARLRQALQADSSSSSNGLAAGSSFQAPASPSTITEK